MGREYLKATNLYEEAERRKNELEGYCAELAKRFDKYPPGRIHVIKRKGGVQYYLRNDAKDKSGKYIPKSDKRLIKALLQKKYDEKVYRLLCKEKADLDTLLRNADAIVGTVRAIYAKEHSHIKNLIEPIDINDEEFAKEWLSVTYKGKEIDENVPFFLTDRHERVRSKSELNIANELNKHGIPYKYECPLVLQGGRVIYPDFTVLNVKRRKVFYWEHRGMMDEREYARHAVQRVKLLVKEGVVAGDNLIITEETSTNPLGTDEITEIIRVWFE